jgi:fructose-bisphosphate aldolase class I
MNTQELIATARAMVAGDKGLLAMDESNPTATNLESEDRIQESEEENLLYEPLAK